APTKALQIIRAFGFFSHLANIAEDQHHIRRTRAHALTTSAPREGSMAHALACAREAGIAPARLRDFFATAMVVPVLTAHPTEVRRKSTIDREMDVADLLDARDRQSLTTAELAANEAALRRAVLTLWQTSPLRRTRLRVIDEVTNGLSYYDYTFLKELPRFYSALEVELAGEGMAPADGLPSFLRMGSWIGDHRDAGQQTVGDAEPYADCAELLGDLGILHESLVANGSAALAQGRLKELRRAVDVFGFHLAALDLRQNSDVHERCIGEMLELVQPGLDYIKRDEAERIRLLLAELDTARPLASAFLPYFDETASELGILRATAEAHR